MTGLRYANGMDALVDYSLRAIEQEPGILQQGIGYVISRALWDMSRDIHPPDDRAARRRPRRQRRREG